MGHWLSGLQDDISGKVFETKVVGVTFEDHLRVVRKMRMGEHVVLRREPHNRYDRNAIRVGRQSGEQVGYIARHEAATPPRVSPYSRGLTCPMPVVVCFPTPA